MSITDKWLSVMLHPETDEAARMYVMIVKMKTFSGLPLAATGMKKHIAATTKKLKFPPFFYRWRTRTKQKVYSIKKQKKRKQPCPTFFKSHEGSGYGMVVYPNESYHRFIHKTQLATSLRILHIIKS